MEHIHLDSAALRVLAHPLRARLLSELRLHGAATATQLADRLTTNTGATSYHLRKLAEVGLVVETGQGTGKQRFWTPAQDSHSWSDATVADDPDAVVAANWLRQYYFSHFAEKMARWEDERQHWPTSWRDAAHMSDALVMVTAAELDELMTELETVVERHRERLGDEPRPGARQVTVHLYSMPTDPGERP